MSFPFLSLSSEIRIPIYKLLLCSPEIVHGKKYKLPDGFTPTTLGKVENLPLLKVCRQIYAEASSIFYSENNFTFMYYDSYTRFYKCITTRTARSSGIELVATIRSMKIDMHDQIEGFSELGNLLGCHLPRLTNLQCLHVVLSFYEPSFAWQIRKVISLLKHIERQEFYHDKFRHKLENDQKRGYIVLVNLIIRRSCRPFKKISTKAL